MILPISKDFILKQSQKHGIPSPTEAAYKKWIGNVSGNYQSVVLVWYAPGYYVTYDDRVWGSGIFWRDDYFIIPEENLEVVKNRVDDMVIVNSGRKILILRQYEPGIDFFHHNTIFNKSPKEVVKEYVDLPLSEVYCVKSFNELFNLMRLGLKAKRRFIVIEVESYAN